MSKTLQATSGVCSNKQAREINKHIKFLESTNAELTTQATNDREQHVEGVKLHAEWMNDMYWPLVKANKELVRLVREYFKHKALLDEWDICKHTLDDMQEFTDKHRRARIILQSYIETLPEDDEE